MSELRRSVRANKGQHPKSADHEYPSLVKRSRNSKKAAKPTEPEPEPEDSEDDAAVRCVCGATEDLGGRMMIECEGCKVWQHNVCMGITESPDDSLTFHCEQCKPELHKELLEAMKRGERIWETRLAAVEKKRKGKKRAQGNRRGQKASPTADVEAENTLKRKHEGDEGPGTRDDHKRFKPERKEPISSSPRSAEDLVRDLNELGPIAIQSGHFTLPAGTSLEEAIRTVVAPIEQELSPLDDVSFYSRLTSIRQSLRLSPTAVARFLSGDPNYNEPASATAMSVKVETGPKKVTTISDRPPAKLGGNSKKPAGGKPEGSIEFDSPSRGQVVSRSRVGPDGHIPGVASGSAPNPSLDAELERILNVSGNSLPTHDIKKESLSAIVRDPSFAFLRTVLQGTQCSVRVSGRFVGGGDFRTLYSLDSLVPKPIELNGRTPAEGGDLYCSLLDPISMDVMVCALEPLPTSHDQSRWEYVFEYYQTKSRWGVVNTGTLSEPVLDMYVIPLGPSDPFPRFFQKLRFVSIAVKRTAPLLLLAIVARTRTLGPNSADGSGSGTYTTASASTFSSPNAHNHVDSTGANESGGYQPASTVATPLSGKVLSNGNGAPPGNGPISSGFRPYPPLRPSPMTPAFTTASSPSSTSTRADQIRSNPVTAGSVQQLSVMPSPSVASGIHTSSHSATTTSKPISSLTSPGSTGNDLSVGAFGSLSSSTAQHPTFPRSSEPGQLQEQQQQQQQQQQQHQPSLQTATAPPPNAHSPIPQVVLEILGPLAHLPVVSQLQEANVLPEMGTAKLKTLHAVLTAHSELHADLGRLVTFLQQLENADEGAGAPLRPRPFGAEPARRGPLLTGSAPIPVSAGSSAVVSGIASATPSASSSLFSSSHSEMSRAATAQDPRAPVAPQSSAQVSSTATRTGPGSSGAVSVSSSLPPPLASSVQGTAAGAPTVASSSAGSSTGPPAVSAISPPGIASVSHPAGASSTSLPTTASTASIPRLTQDGVVPPTSSHSNLLPPSQHAAPMAGGTPLPLSGPPLSLASTGQLSKAKTASGMPLQLPHPPGAPAPLIQQTGGAGAGNTVASTSFSASVSTSSDLAPAGRNPAASSASMDPPSGLIPAAALSARSDTPPLLPLPTPGLQQQPFSTAPPGHQVSATTDTTPAQQPPSAVPGAQTEPGKESK